MATIAAFDDLPTDLLRAVCCALPTSDLMRLCLASRAASLCCDDSFFRERAAAAGLTTCNAEVLALHELLTNSLSDDATPQCVTAQVGFQYGGKTLDDDAGSEAEAEAPQADEEVA